MWVQRIDFVPVHRCGDACVGNAADGVRRRNGVIPSVLVVVHEQVRGVAVLAPPSSGDLGGGTAFNFSGEGERGAAYLLKTMLRRNPHIDVHPRPAARFRESHRTQIVQYFVGNVGHSLDRGKVASRPRVEVNAPFVGHFGVRPPAVPRVKLNRRHLHGPDHAGQFGDAQFVSGAAPAREEKLDRLDPWRRPSGQPFLVHLVASESLGETVQHAGTLKQRVDDAGANRQVVVDQIELGRSRVREVDPVGIAYAYDASLNLNFDGRRLGGWHSATLSAATPLGGGLSYGLFMKFDQSPVVGVTVRRDARPSLSRWPGSIPAVQQMVRDGLELAPGVTFLVGENGSGKSTIVEAVATAYGLSPEGGSAQGHHSTRASESSLGEALEIKRGLGGPRWGFFLRAETMHAWYTFLESNPPTSPYTVEPKLHEMSHGESFLAVLAMRFGKAGFYCLDEPEAALSFASTLELIAVLQRVVADGGQVLCATHSPALASLPGARISRLAIGVCASVPGTSCRS